MSDLNRDLLEAAFYQSPDAIVIVDEAGRIVHVNPRVEELFGYEPSALEGELVERLVPEPERDRHEALRTAYMEDPESRPPGTNLDLRARRADGSTVPVDISLSPIETDDDSLVLASIRDRAEQVTLRRKYRTVFEVAPNAMVLADLETGRLLEVNRRAADLVGTTTDDLVGRRLVDLHPEDERERFRSLLRRAVESDGTFRTNAFDGDLHVLTDGGDRIPVEITSRTVELADRRVIIGAIRDVSAQREYERKLHRQIDRLERFAHLVSHDLRNPLAVATGYLEQTKETGDLDYLEEVESEHERMEELIEAVLTMVRQGYDVESVEPLSFESIVTACWGHVETAGARLELESEGLLYADSDRVRHVFENLFRNAVEHGSTSPDSQARQDTGRRSASSEPSVATAPEDAVEPCSTSFTDGRDTRVDDERDEVTVWVGLLEDGFYVEDDGPGIPVEAREEVFEPGWTTTSEGTGLGLNVVYEIANAHGWHVEVVGGRADGARFVFSDARTAIADGSFAVADCD